jgi:hypothetical protein
MEEDIAMVRQWGSAEAPHHAFATEKALDSECRINGSRCVYQSDAPAHRKPVSGLANDRGAFVRRQDRRPI